MAKITFEDKVALNPQPSIAEKNKCTDANINEIKTSVNALYDDLSGLIKRASVDANTTYQNLTSVSANVPAGYTFLCWLTPSSYGSVNSAYMENYWQQTTNIWQTTNNNNNATFHCGYLMVKNGILG